MDSFVTLYSDPVVHLIAKRFLLPQTWISIFPSLSTKESQNKNETIYRSLLQKNRDIIHGAFVLDATGEKVIFRDTLQLENLDLNEIEASLNSLGLLLSEYSNQIIEFSKY